MSYLGLDIGTGGCKAVVFSNKGVELGQAFREYRVLRPYPDWAELNPDEVISKCFEVIEEVNSKIDDPGVSMSISSQGEAFTPVGLNGNALGAGVTDSGTCMYATGSVECFCPVLEKPGFSEELRKNNLCCYD